MYIRSSVKSRESGSCFDPNESIRGVLIRYRCGKQVPDVETARYSLKSLF
ncbi:hypothetical protein HanXRQr2_Chr11g0483511 [Helianthus annuus]|uniref:Uncharacterized protein n=1 Tax=Helianthus annuus TaxID=4232 RepID=A0A9K3HN28_HELAN|nr:hypothetical protein HanXRQr2_Chr11g0483511 [Helianthus annuus]